MSERIRTTAAAAMLGISRRTVQAMVARGGLPGAAKIGGILTFDSSKLRRYLDGEEARCRKTTCIREERSGGCAPPLTEQNTARAYDAAMSKLLGKDGISASRR